MSQPHRAGSPSTTVEIVDEKVAPGSSRARSDKIGKGRPKQKRQINKLVLVSSLLVALALVALGYLGFTRPQMLVFAAPLLLLVVPFFMARIKRQNGSAYSASDLMPRQGIRGIFWKVFGADVFAIFGWSWLKAPSLRDRERQALNMLWELRHVQKIIAFANSKGGSGKTPMTTWLSCLWAWAIKQPPLALDINENPNHTATWLGIDPSSTLQLRAFLRACLTGDMKTASELLAQCEWHRQTGTTVISAEATSLEAFSPEQVIVGIKVAKAHNHSVFCDLGNGIIASGNWGAFAMADTAVFCGNVNAANSENDVASTMQRYTELGHEQQVEHSIIAILGAKLKQRAEYADRYEHPVERVFIVPYNRYMAKGNPVDIFKIPRKIRVILLEILVAVIRAESVAKGEIDRSNVKELKITTTSDEAPASTSATGTSAADAA